MRPGKRKTLDLNSALARKIYEVERSKASIRATVEHPFRVAKQQFGDASAAPWLGQENGWADDALRAEQSVHGSPAIAEFVG